MNKNRLIIILFIISIISNINITLSTDDNNENNHIEHLNNNFDKHIQITHEYKQPPPQQHISENNENNEVSNVENTQQLQEQQREGIVEIKEETEEETEEKEKKSVEMVVDRDILCDTKLTKEEHDQVIQKVLKGYFEDLSPESNEYTQITAQFSNYIKNSICNGYVKKSTLTSTLLQTTNTDNNNNKNQQTEEKENINTKQTLAANSAKSHASQFLVEASDTPPTTTTSTSDQIPITTSTIITTITNTPSQQPTIEWPVESNYILNYSVILEMNENNYERIIKENLFVYVLFYAPWCSRSQALLVEFKEAHRIYTTSQFDPPVVFAMADCHRYPIIRDKQSIGGYPVMELFRKYGGGGNIIPRGASSQPATMISFLRRSTLPSLEYIDSMEKFNNFSNIVPYGLVGLFPFAGTNIKNSSNYLVYDNLCKKLSFKFPVAIVNDSSLIQQLSTQFKISPPSQEFGDIILIKPLEKTFIQFDQDYKVSIILRWLSIHYSPIVNELTPDSIHRTIGNKIKQSFLLFTNLTNVSATLALVDRPFSKDISNLIQVSNQYYQSINLYYVDGVTFRDFGERLGVTKLPMMVIIDFEKEEFYTSNPPTIPTTRATSTEPTISTDTITQFLNNYFDNNLKPFKYSDSYNSANNNNQDNVKKIVFNNFESIVLESENKNSIIYFNAPWCGYCRTMDIYYKEAANTLSKQYGDQLQILTYDVEKNSLPIMMKPIINTYPYISLFLSNNKTNPISYNLTRDLNSIIEFVNINLNQQSQQKEEGSSSTTTNINNSNNNNNNDNNNYDYQIYSLGDAEKELI